MQNISAVHPSVVVLNVTAPIEQRSSPILPVVRPEVVHVAALREVHGVLVLSLLGHLDIDLTINVIKTFFVFVTDAPD